MQLTKINHELCAALSKTSLPFIVVEYPSLELENIQVFNFKGKDYEFGYHSHHGKLYQFANPRNKDTIKLIKNTEKEMQKITKLKNSCSFKLSLYEPGETSEATGKLGLEILDRCRIKGHVQSDQELISTLIEILRRISN